MSVMNDLDLQLNEHEEFYNRMADEAMEGFKTIKAVRQKLLVTTIIKLSINSRKVIQFKIKSRSARSWLRSVRKVIPNKSKSFFISSVPKSCRILILKITRICITVRRESANELT